MTRLIDRLELVSALALACLALGCASVPEPRQVKQLLDESMHAANTHLSRQEPIEAMQFLDAVAAVDKEYPGLQQAYQQVGTNLPPGVAGAFKPNALGVNRPPRYPVERTSGQKVMLYVPDRLVDLLDCITFDVHLGPGLYFNYRATRAVQAGGGVRGVFGVGTYGARSILGTQAVSEAGISLLMMEAEAKAGALASASGFKTATRLQAGMNRPTDPYYQSFSDYWEVGTSWTFFVGGFEFAAHPIQIGDFFAGFGMVDFLRDDWATSRAMNIGRKERELVGELVSVAGSTDAVTAYTNWIREQRTAGGAPAQEPAGAAQPN